MLSFDMLQHMDLPWVEMFSVDSTFYDAFLTFPYVPCESIDALGDSDRDIVVMVAKKSRDDAMREICEHSGRVVGVFTPGDVGPSLAQVGGGAELPPNVIALYAPNNELTDSRAVSVPLGVKAERLHCLAAARRNRPLRKKLCYANFTVDPRLYWPDRSGRAHIRFRLADRMRSAQWIDWDLSCTKRTAVGDLLRYYAQIAAHKFVLSPPGRGVDCYRTWEALYLGAVPIILDSTPMSAFSDLPILFTKDYSELSEDYLEQQWREISSRSFDIDRMLKSWYRHRFLESVSKLEEPYFACLWVDESRSPESVVELMRSARTPTLPPESTAGAFGQ